MGCQALGACHKNRDGNWSPMFNLCRQVPLSIALIGDPAPLHRGVRSSNHDRGCDRRDAWVGLSPDLKTITSEPTVGKGNTINESEMALFFECMQSCARKGLDTGRHCQRRDVYSCEFLRVSTQPQAAEMMSQSFNPKTCNPSAP